LFVVTGLLHKKKGENVKEYKVPKNKLDVMSIEMHHHDYEDNKN